MWVRIPLTHTLTACAIRPFYLPPVLSVSIHTGVKYRMSNFTQQLMGRRHTKRDNTRNTLCIIMAVQSSLCKSGTCAPFKASHSNHTKFKYSTENAIGVMSCGVLNWSVRPGSHAVHCHVQFVYKHAVWRLRYGLPDDFLYTKLNLFIFL